MSKPQVTRIQFDFYSPEDAGEAEDYLLELMSDQDGWSLVVEDWSGNYIDSRPPIHIFLDLVTDPKIVIKSLKDVAPCFSGVVHQLIGNKAPRLVFEFNHNDNIPIVLNHPLDRSSGLSEYMGVINDLLSRVN